MRLLDMEFADLDAANAAALIARRSCAEPFRYVTTPNADHLVRLHRHPELRPLYQGAMLRLLDSRVVALGGRLIGLKVPHVATGSDLTSLLLSEYLQPAERITIIGLSRRWLPELAARCALVSPAHYDPPRGFERDPAALRATVEFVLAHPARFVFLAVGSPRQEILAAAIQGTGQARGIGLCIGASLEFLASARRRAPEWMQHADLEWLYRLAHNPRGLTRRYLIDSPLILPLLLHERFGPAGSR